MPETIESLTKRFTAIQTRVQLEGERWRAAVAGLREAVELLAGQDAATEGRLSDILRRLEALEDAPPRDPEPDPDPEPEPDPEPPSLIVGLDVDAGWGSNSGIDARGCVSHARTEDEADKLDRLQSAGLTLNVNFAGPYNPGGVQALDADRWVADALAFYKANTTPEKAPIIEVLNEPYGTWFWGSNAPSASNAVAYRELVRKTYNAFHSAYGSDAPLITASVDGAGGVTWGARWWNPECASFCDGAIVHPYGGTGSKTVSALGNRKLIEDAHSLTKKPVYVTEVGWPTAVGKPSTGDSLQWTEAEQAQNITNFIAWCRSKPYVAQVIYFNWHDYGTNAWYGVVRTDGSHKPSYDALKAA